MNEHKGIIRRIDELGRIVIPREYRKLHGIELGDPIEITALSSGEIVLKRVDTGEELIKAAGRMFQAVGSELPGVALVSDFEKFLLGCNEGNRPYLKREIGKWTTKLLKDRNTYLGPADEKDGPELGEGKYAGLAVVPLLLEGDCFGGLFFLSTEPISSELFRTLLVLAKSIAVGMHRY